MYKPLNHLALLVTLVGELIFPRRRRTAIGVAGLVVVGAMLQSPTPAQAAALWAQSANSALARTVDARSKPNPDPAYRPPQKHGVSYVAPKPKASSAKSAAGTEKVSLRTRTSRTFSGSGRSMTTLVYPQSVNYRDAAGAWQAIDDTLVKASTNGYAYQN